MSLKKSLIFIINLNILTTLVYPQFCTIMIDPAGDAQSTGREIQDTFERGITLQFAQELKQQLIERMPNIRVVLTRIPGEAIQPMHNAIFANRLQVQLYLRIGFYHEKAMPSRMAIFYYCQDQTDYWHKFNPLQFYPYQQAHLMNLKLTEKFAQYFLQKLQNNNINSAFIPHNAFAIPIKPLLGIQAPALYIEAGLININDWKYLIKPIMMCIQEVLTYE